MPKQTRSTDGGLSSPSVRANSGQSANNGTPARNQEHAAGIEIPVGEDTESGIESKPAEPERIGGFATADPFSAPIGNDRPRRGRPKGWKKQQQAEAASVSNLASLAKIENILLTGTLILGNLASAPELCMSRDEAKEITEALKELAKHYPIGMSEKTMAWVNFSFAFGGYGARAGREIWNRPKPTKVVNIRPEPEAEKPEETKSSTPYTPTPFVFNDGAQEE